WNAEELIFSASYYLIMAMMIAFKSKQHETTKNFKKIHEKSLYR
ncbi:9229_t:CDS:1, partial [Gigaspora rosea]